jgi:hypothetical protein
LPPLPFSPLPADLCADFLRLTQLAIAFLPPLALSLAAYFFPKQAL